MLIDTIPSSPLDQNPQPLSLVSPVRSDSQNQNSFPNSMGSQQHTASEIVPTIVNVISTVNVGCELDLHKIATKVPNAEYSPKRMPSVIIRFRDPKATVLIFASGKMVCTGAKSEAESELAVRKCVRSILNVGFDVKFKDFKVQNMVGSCGVGFPIRLHGLAYANPQCTSYEPELFPGLRYRMKEPKITILVFSSGKLVITGAKRREDICKAFEVIYPALENSRN